jgi:hypothetical protein
MNTEDIKLWISEPGKMNRESMLDLRATLETYPCFTAARTLYLRNLLNLNDLSFSNELVRTAILVPDRRLLYYFIEGKKLPDYKLHPSAGQIQTGGFNLIDRFLRNTDTVAPVSPIEPKKEKAPVAESEQVSIPTVSKPKLVERADNKKGLLVNTESALLDYTRYLVNQPELGTPIAPMDGQELIDRFLEGGKTMDLNQRQTVYDKDSEAIFTVSEDATVLLEDPAFHLPEDSFTETLARIYLKQKRYDKAVEIFKSLSLKYPEKSTYFADQIRFLEKLIENLKK